MNTPQEGRQRLVFRFVVIALIAVVVATVVAWIYTVRELNRLTAYDPVGIEALRLARLAHDVRDAPPGERIGIGRRAHPGGGVVKTRLATEPPGGERP